MTNQRNFEPEVSVLTAGRDRHYSLGLAMALAAAGVKLDFIASDELQSDELQQFPNVNFYNLRGDQSVNASFFKKTWRVLAYYFRLLVYVSKSKSKIFHILWNNKFEWFDRTVLMAFYRLLGKKIVFTAHNVNAGIRDGYDSGFNRLTLKFQYRLCDRILVHTNKMKSELVSDFNVPEEKIVLIPYGWNNVVPDTALTSAEARQQLGLNKSDKVILFFGNIAPYKGVEFLVEAFEMIATEDPSVRLVIAGRPRGPKEYWEQLKETIEASRWRDRIIQKIEYISDDDMEVYFKAADISALPYVHIFQSGVLFLGYSFGLPVVATDVGSLKEEIFEGKTGLVCEPKDPHALARAIRSYFQSDLYRRLATRRREIQDFARDKYSWTKVGAITTAAYEELLRGRRSANPFSKIEKPNETLSLHSRSSI
jgi:glycosyltransferase involved in cell wall biosynthesis